MLDLFHINDYSIDTSTFDHYLHGTAVTNFEEEFCEYVGASYACTFSSATNAIFLTFLNRDLLVKVPSMIPPVVLNALLNGGNRIEMYDDVDWVGGSYVLHTFDNFKVIDSAQRVDRDQFKNEANPEDLMIFSFYPTKPVGSLDGGIIVSNDLEKIEWFKSAVLNGMSFDKDNWSRKIEFPGWKMYMSTFQAVIASNNLSKLDNKIQRLSEIREQYNSSLGYVNTSSHLYRINVNNRSNFMDTMLSAGIKTGIHYPAMHSHSVYSKHLSKKQKKFTATELLSKKTVSIPFHENLTNSDVSFIVEKVQKSGVLY